MLPFRSFVLALFLGVGYIATVSEAALPVDTLFRVDLSLNSNGGCGYAGRITLQRKLDEAEDLTRNALIMIRDASKNEYAQRVLRSFLQIRDATQLGEVKGMLNFLIAVSVFPNYRTCHK